MTKNKNPFPKGIKRISSRPIQHWSGAYVQNLVDDDGKYLFSLEGTISCQVKAAADAIVEKWGKK